MMRIFTIFMAVIICGSLSAQEVIWGGPGDPNGEFDGGLNDWTAVGVSPNENALWVWNEDGIADDGAYAGVQPIASASVANGAASFDSDFYDNAGTPGNFGNGVAAAPQRGELISPEFSTAGFPEVSIAWTQYFRQFLSSYSIEITSDGGATWTSVPIGVNNALSTNVASATNMNVTLNVGEIMGDKETVQFKFVYEANYYFWTIDDVSVIVTPDHDLVATAMYYPFNAGTVPTSFLNADTLEFALDVWNNGGLDQSDATATIQIIDEAGTAVYEFSENSGPIAKGDTVGITFTDVVLPEDVNLAEGVYTIQYEVVPADGDDFFPNDNGLVEAVVVSADVYSLTNGGTSGISYNSGNYGAAMILRTGDLPENMEYFTEATFVRGIDENQDAIVNALGEFSVMKLLNQVGEELDPLDASTAYGTLGGHENLEVVGYGFFSAEGIANGTDIEVEILNADDDELGVVLEDNTTYIFTLKWDITNNGGLIFTGAARTISFFQTVSLVHFPDNDWFTIAPDIAWYMPTVVTTRTIDNNELTELDENAVSVYPNPAVNTTTVELDFTQATDAAIILRDNRGGYITTKSVTGVTNQQVEFDITNLPAGSYSFEITTSENERTVKSFIKVQ